MKKNTILDAKIYNYKTFIFMKRLNYFWKDAKLILLGLLCSCVILAAGLYDGLVVDAHEVAGVFTVVAYLLLVNYPRKRKTAETVLMPMAVASIALVFALGWWTWPIVFGLTLYHAYFLEKNRDIVFYLDVASIVFISLFCCGMSHLIFWLFSLI